jgi:hypothetical protein
MTTTLSIARTTVSASAVDRTNPNSDYLPLGKVINLSLTTHVEEGGIISSSDTAFSIEETIELIERLSSALETATAFTK